MNGFKFINLEKNIIFPYGQSFLFIMELKFKIYVYF